MIYISVVCEHPSLDIQKEIANFDDLIIGEFLDTYENLPIKTFLGYKFLSEKCMGKYDFVTFTDDDALLDLKNLIRLFAETNKSEPSIHCLKGHPIELRGGKCKKFLDALAKFQNLNTFLAPHTGKYYLWEELYPENFKPPAYCNGQCAMMTSSAADKIYAAARKTNRHEFRLEDFYYVGILRTKGILRKIFKFFITGTYWLNSTSFI